MPKCEIFHRSDFHDFYTIKSLWGGGGVVTFRGSSGAAKLLARMLSLILRSIFFSFGPKKFFPVVSRF